jgi:hypothetical protein
MSPAVPSSTPVTCRLLLNGSNVVNVYDPPATNGNPFGVGSVEPSSVYTPAAVSSMIHSFASVVSMPPRLTTSYGVAISNAPKS